MAEFTIKKPTGEVVPAIGVSATTPIGDIIENVGELENERSRVLEIYGQLDPTRAKTPEESYKAEIQRFQNNIQVAQKILSGEQKTDVVLNLEKSITELQKGRESAIKTYEDALQGKISGINPQVLEEYKQTGKTPFDSQLEYAQSFLDEQVKKEKDQYKRILDANQSILKDRESALSKVTQDQLPDFYNKYQNQENKFLLTGESDYTQMLRDNQTRLLTRTPFVTGLEAAKPFDIIQSQFNFDPLNLTDIQKQKKQKEILKEIGTENLEVQLSKAGLDYFNSQFEKETAEAKPILEELQAKHKQVMDIPIPTIRYQRTTWGTFPTNAGEVGQATASKNSQLVALENQISSINFGLNQTAVQKAQAEQAYQENKKQLDFLLGKATGLVGPDKEIKLADLGLKPEIFSGLKYSKEIPSYQLQTYGYTGAPANVTTDYAASIKRAQETGIHLPVFTNLAPTFQKDEDKRFQNLLDQQPKQTTINLTENLGLGGGVSINPGEGEIKSSEKILADVLPSSADSVSIPGITQPQRESRTDKLLGDQGNATKAIMAQLEYQTKINTPDTTPDLGIGNVKTSGDILDQGLGKEYTINLIEGGITKEQAKQERLEGLGKIKDFIGDVQKSGRTDLILQTSKGSSVINPNTAYKTYLEALAQDPTATLKLPAMISLSESLNISDAGPLGPIKITQDKKGKINTLIAPLPETPKVFNVNQFIPLSLDTKGNLSGLATQKDLSGLVTLQPAKITPKESSPLVDFLDKQTKDIEKYVEKSTGIARPGALIIKSAYSLVPSTIGLLSAATSYVSKTPLPLPKVPETGTGSIIESIAQGKGEPLAKYIAENGGPILGSIGLGAEITSDVVLGAGKGPLNIAKGVLEVIPEQAGKGSIFAVRYTAKEAGREIPVIKEFESLEKATDFSILAKKQPAIADVTITAYSTPIKSLTLGISNEIGVPIISKVGSKTVIGSPLKGVTKDIFEGVSPTGRGLEYGTEGSLLQKIFTSEKGKTVQKEAGILTEQGSTYIDIGKDIAKAVKQVQKEIAPTQEQSLADIKFENLLGKEKEVLIEKVLPTLEPAKGGFAQVVQTTKDLLKGTGRGDVGDIDVDYGNVAKSLKYIGLGKVAENLGTAKAIKAVENAQKELQAVAQGNRVFKVEGTKLVVGEFGGKVEFNINKAEQNVLYHGTDIKSAENILKEGFDISKSGKQTSNYLEYQIGDIDQALKRADKIITEGVYATPNPNLGSRFAGTAAKGNPLDKALIKITLKPNANILKHTDIPKGKIDEFRQLTGSDWRAFNKKLIEYARTGGFEGLSHPISKSGLGNKEIILFSQNPILKKELIKAVPTLEKKSKVLELLTEGEVVPKASISPTENLNKVFGTKYSYDILKGKTPKGKTFKTRSLLDQLLTKVASTASLQGPRSEGALVREGEFLKPGKFFETTDSGFFFGTPTFRVKDIVDQPILLRQTAKNIRALGLGEKKALNFEDLANRVEANFPEVQFRTDIPITERGLPQRPSLLARSGITQSTVRPILVKSSIDTLKPSKQQVKPSVSIDKTASDITNSIRQSAAQKIDSKSIIGKGSSLEQLVKSRINVSTGPRVRTSSIIQPSRGSAPRGRSPSTSINSIASQIKSSNINSLVDSISKSKPSRIIESKPSSVSITSPSSISRLSTISPSVTSPSLSSPASVVRPSPTSPASPINISPVSPIFGSPTSPIGGSPTGLSPAKGSPGIKPKFNISVPFTYTERSRLLFPPIKLPKKKFRKKSSYFPKTLFYTNPSDPLRAGVILAQGVKEYQSYSYDIFKKVDVELSKSRKRNQFAGLDQPQVGFDIGKIRGFKKQPKPKSLLSKNFKIRI